jgi:uncharacterized membrane protein
LTKGGVVSVDPPRHFIHHGAFGNDRFGVLAERFARFFGTPRFIIGQTIVVILWIAANAAAFSFRWDPYPFILLNLALSFQAAYAAPFIMMSQNRQQDVDRHAAENDHQINIKAELEIELLHQKIDELRETEVLQLIEAVRELAALLRTKVEPSTFAQT